MTATSLWNQAVELLRTILPGGTEIALGIGGEAARSALLWGAGGALGGLLLYVVSFHPLYRRWGAGGCLGCAWAVGFLLLSGGGFAYAGLWHGAGRHLERAVEDDLLLERLGVRLAEVAGRPAPSAPGGERLRAGLDHEALAEQLPPSYRPLAALLPTETVQRLLRAAEALPEVELEDLERLAIAGRPPRDTGDPSLERAERFANATAPLRAQAVLAIRGTVLPNVLAGTLGGIGAAILLALLYAVVLYAGRPRAIADAAVGGEG